MTTIRNIFGDYLRLKIADSKYTSAKSLAEEIEKVSDEKIDPSLIRHWLRGARIPTSDHAALPWIAKVLGIQEEEIKKHVKMAQARKTRREGDSLIGAFDPLMPKISAESKKDKTSEESTTYESSLLSTQEILNTIVSILRSLPEKPKDDNKNNKKKPTDKDDGTIFSSFQGKALFFQDFENPRETKDQWFKAIQNALDKGWHVNHLLRLHQIEGDYSQVVELVTYILNFVGRAGDYHPLVFPKSQIFQVAYSLFLVPKVNDFTKKGHGMICLGGENADYIDKAIYTDDDTQIKILKQHFKQLETGNTDIFQNWIEKKDQEKLIDRLLDANQVPGDRIVILKRLPEVIRPLQWYESSSSWVEAEWSNGKKLLKKNVDLKELIRKRKELVELFKASAESQGTESKYIYTDGCIEEFASTGKLCTSSDDFTVPPSEQVKVLTNMIEQLIPCDVAILDKYVLEQKSIKPSLCEVVKGRYVLMEVTPEGKDTSWIFMDEPTIVQAFYEYLSHLWKTLPEEYKDRKRNRALIREMRGRIQASQK
jgi:hypothetical protein